MIKKTLSVLATTIDITTEAPLIQTENGIRSTAIQSAQVTGMPAQGRNWSTLLKIIPGATPVSNQGIVGRELDSSGYNDFRVNGKDGRQTQMNLDGGSILNINSADPFGFVPTKGASIPNSPDFQDARQFELKVRLDF